MSEAISDYELEEEGKHNASSVRHDEYDADTEELFDKIEALEKQFAELKKQLEELKSWL